MITKRILALSSFFGIIIFLVLIFVLISRSKRESFATIPVVVQATTLLLQEEEASSTPQFNYGLPVRLTIPKINVATTIESVGLTKEGEMGVPKFIENVAWFELGSRPGEIGNAVIGGHYGWKNNKVSAFDELHTLQKGDMVLIEDDKGKTILFVVREVKKYEWKSDSDDVFISSDGKSHLNLITCEGTWNKVDKSYSNRLVVFTDKID